jgi:ribosomal protein S18 acetylase RimI-like enzyme
MTVSKKSNTVESITIRKVMSSDLKQLQHISKQTFYETFSPANTEENMRKYLEEDLSAERLKKEINNPGSEFYFAILNDDIIGYMKLNTGNAQTEINDFNALEIERIYVLKEYLGKKVGQILFEKAVHVARQKKASFIWLGVWEENKRAISFYKKNGFEEFGRHLFKLGDDEQTDIMMKREVN